MVGPNGSGKSNVIDALLFVFGSRAKKIRQDKLKDLIHNSEDHRDLPSCRVSVHFQDIIDRPDGSFDVVPGTEIVVAREALRSSQSLYYLNGKKQTFKAIGTLLREKGIDLDHNRFLILQGEVEQIAMMKPKAQTEHDEGLLEYLEDIIGSDRFKEEIATAGERVEALNESRNEKLNRVKIIEKEKDALEAGKTEAEGFLRLENELTIKQSVIFQCNRADAAAKKAEAETKLSEFTATYEAAKADLKSSTAELKTIEKAYKKKASKVAKIQAAVDTAKAEFSAFERKDVKLREDVKHAKSKIKKTEKTMTKDKAAMGEETARVTALEEDAERAAANVTELQAKVATEEKVLDEIYDSLKEETATLTVKLTPKQEELRPLSKARDEARSAADLVRSELELLTSDARNLQQQLTDTQANLVSAKETVAARTGEASTLSARKAEAEKELATAEGKLAQLTDSEAPLEARVKSARSQVEEGKSASQQAQSSNAVIQALSALSNKGKLQGFHGRLGDLGAIDDKYDCAITTACGALNHLVVDTVAQAKACVEYLKKGNIGRATFIILEKMTGLAERAAQPIKTPEGAARLYDLVRVKDDMFSGAFYFALRDTLVAMDLEQASRVAYSGKKWRVVSLQGQLIDTSGTMSGGGRKALRGGMSSKLSSAISPDELVKLESELEQSVAMLAETRAARKELTVQVKTLTAELKNIARELKKGAIEIEALTTQVPALEAQVAELQSRNVTVDASRQADLEAKLADADKVLAAASAEAEVVEQAIEAIEAEILAVGGVQLKAQKSKVEGLNARIATAQATQTKAKVDGKTATRKVKQLEKKLAKATETLTEANAQVESSMAELKGMEEQAAEVMEAYKEASMLLEEQADSAKAMKAEYDELQDKMAELQKTQVDLDHKLGEMKRALKDSTVKEAHWANKLSKLSLHAIEHSLNVSIEEGDDAASAAVSSSKLSTLSTEDIEAVDCEEIQFEITVLEEKLKKIKPNLAAIEEYRTKEEEYLARVADLDTITTERDTLRSSFEALRKQRLDTFMAGFSIITMKLKEMYQMITLGGDAELELVDRLNPFSEGIVFSVRPPKKSWKNISNLSGGEKTLSSLALVFALHHFKPTPLYVMDEIDAALDFKNVSIVANYIKERTKNAQFIIISLRNNMFELADRLIGIYKTDDCTKSVTINPALVAEAASRHAESRDEAAAVPLAPVQAQAAPLVV